MNDMITTSGKQVTLASLMNKHRDVFAAMREVGGKIRRADEYTKSLIPMIDATSIIASLGNYLKPCGPDVAGLLAAEFMGAFQKRDMQDPDSLKRWLIKEIQEAPRDIAINAVDTVARSAMYGPKIADLQKEILRLSQRRRDMLIVVQSHKMEHVRRDAVRQDEAKYAREVDGNGLMVVDADTFKALASMGMQGKYVERLSRLSLAFLVVSLAYRLESLQFPMPV